MPRFPAKSAITAWMTALVYILWAWVVSGFGSDEPSGVDGVSWFGVLRTGLWQMLLLLLIMLPGYSLLATQIPRHIRLEEIRSWAGSFRLFGAGVLLGLFFRMVTFAFLYLAGSYAPVEFAWSLQPAETVGSRLAESALIQLRIGIVEEFVLRRFLLQFLYARASIALSVVASSFVFGLLHLGRAEAGFPLWAVFVSTFLVGMVLAQAFLVSRSLWFVAGFHAAANYFLRVLGGTDREVSADLLILARAEGPKLLRGPEGPGAGAIELAVLLCVSLFLLSVARRRRAPSERGIRKPA